MNYSQKEIDYIHDTFIDLIISCMRSGYMHHEEPKIGDWCIEISHFCTNENRDDCIGKLVNTDVKNNKKTIETIGGKIVNWYNTELVKIPNKYMRK